MIDNSYETNFITCCSSDLGLTLSNGVMFFRDISAFPGHFCFRFRKNHSHETIQQLLVYATALFVWTDTNAGLRSRHEGHRRVAQMQ